MEIDIETYGRSNPEPAAATQQSFEQNSYNPDEDYPVNQALLADVLDAQKPESAPIVPESNPQADNFRALREEVDRIKAEKDLEKREYQLQIDMLKANIKQEVRPERKMFDGMDDSDVPNVKELRAEWNARETSYKQRLEELQVQSQHSDYHDVLSNYLAPLIRQKPYLAQGIQSSDNPSLMAYELGKMAQASQQQPRQEQPIIPQRSETAQRIVDNSRKIGTLSQAGGQTSLSQADYFATMSDQEFMRMASKNLEGI